MVKCGLRAAIGLAALCLLPGCSGNPVASSPTTAAPRAPAPSPGIRITVSANACGTGWRHPSTGLQTFQIDNISEQPVDVSLTNADTAGVYAEVEGVGPGTIRPIQVDVGSGAYAFQCDSGDGAMLTGPTVLVPGGVQGQAAIVPPDVAGTLAAVTAERSYVSSGLAVVIRQVSLLTADIQAGNLVAARGAWLTAHLSYERLGSAYGMFGNFDDEIDGTPGGLPGGVNDPAFTGFYRLEYGLWHGQKAAQLTGPAQQLGHDIAALRTAYPGLVQYPQAALSDLALRTHEILEHTIRFQLSGADDFGSGTTLATAAANIDATQAQLAMLRPILLSRYPRLPMVDTWLDRLQRLIDAEQADGRWTPVSALTATERESIDSAAAQTVQLLAPIAIMLESSSLS